MQGFDHILNWTLKKGSHQFPGPDGGTCINEAALVAMGFEYRPIAAAWQMPSCFSHPICRLAMRLNALARQHPGTRVLAGSFALGKQAIAVPKHRPAALRYVCRFMEEAKASGLVQRALDAARIREEAVAPRESCRSGQTGGRFHPAPPSSWQAGL